MLRTTLHIPPRTWWRFLTPRPQAMFQHNLQNFPSLLHKSKGILLITLVAESAVKCMTCSRPPHPDVARLLSSFLLYSGCFDKVCKFAIRNLRFTDFPCRRLPSTEIVQTCQVLKTTANFRYLPPSYNQILGMRHAPFVYLHVEQCAEHCLC